MSQGVVVGIDESSAVRGGVAVAIGVWLVGCATVAPVAPVSTAPVSPEPATPVIEFYEGETTVFAANGDRIAQGRILLKRTIDSTGSAIVEEAIAESSLVEVTEAGQLPSAVRTFVLDGKTFTFLDHRDQVRGTGEVDGARLRVTTQSSDGATLELIREQTSRGFFTSTQRFDARGMTLSKSEAHMHEISPERFAREVERL